MSKPIHIIGTYDKTGIGGWPLVRCPAYAADPSNDVVATDEHAMLTVETMDPSVSQFYPLGITFDQAHELNFKLRTVDIVLNSGAAPFVRHYSNHAPYGGDLLTTDENDLDRWPGIAITKSESVPPNIINTILSIGVVFDGVLNGPTYGETWPVGCLDVLFEGPGTTIQGSVCAKFFSGKVYPFIYYVGTFVASVSGLAITVTSVNIQPGSVTSAHQLNVLGWGSMPLYLYYSDPSDTDDISGDVLITPHAGVDAYFGYSGTYNTATGAKL